MESQTAFQRYQQLQQYVGWTPLEAERVIAIGRLLAPHLPGVIEDFYAVMRHHPAAFRVITGGAAQIARLQQTLAQWLADLFSGNYDETYVERRFRAGQRHVAIELEQMYTSAAMSRLRSGLLELLRQHWPGDTASLIDAIGSLSKLLDLDLAIIEDAYDRENTYRQRLAERARIRDVLHQEKELSAGLWEHAQAIILVLDTTGGIIRYNPYLEDLTGVPHQEVVGQHWCEHFVPQRERERLHEVFAGAVRHDTSSTVSSVLTREGRERRISWSNKSLKDTTGRPVAILAVGQDITELNDAQQRALQAERLAGIGQISTGLAHESRNALQRIQACAEMLELEVEHNPQALDLVHRIKLAQDHLHRLLEEVRGYAAPLNLDLSPCQLRSVWREAWEMLLPQRAGRVVELVECPTDTALDYCGDHFRLVQLFRILFENSLAACRDPARIEIACRAAAGNAAVGLCLSVRDNGPGMNAEQRARVFEPFYTTKTKGTGLGLAIAKRIVEAHGGQIAVGEDAQPGAQIMVTLPHRADE
ncbi:MAG: protoglobin domain-containing protein [Pirellulaceae bacterium]|jgi:hypothetical protein|nr:protoglobin domain-containing protein [Pirellulaceae bacterium]